MPGVNFQICQMPAGPAGGFTQGNGVFFVVNNNTQATDAVYELMKFWETDWAQINWSSKTGFAPTRTDLAGNDKITSNPNVKAFADSLQSARTYLGGVVEYSKINDEVIMPAILEVARGNMTAQDASDCRCGRHERDLWPSSSLLYAAVIGSNPRRAARFGQHRGWARWPALHVRGLPCKEHGLHPQHNTGAAVYT